MPFFLRIIRRGRWFTAPGVGWLAPGEIQADALLDLTPEGNSLSVYFVEDDRSNLERVATALAAGRNDPVNFDYALFDAAVLSRHGIVSQQVGGGTPDLFVNSNWHHDLQQLTVTQIAGLTAAIAGGLRDRLPQKRVVQMIKDGVRAGAVDRTQMRDSLRAKLGL